jgi:hypothetical protein
MGVAMVTSDDVKVTSTGSSFMNGELFTMSYEARASARDGTIETEWELSSLPDGVSILTLVDCTSAGVSPVFARESNGGANLMTLSGGNYRLTRTFDYGEYGSYEFNYVIRSDSEGISSTGVQEGDLRLPEVESADLSLVEYLIPDGPGRLRGFMQTHKKLASGEKIPVSISGVYSPLPGDRDWTLDAVPQVRRSEVSITESGGPNKLHLKYETVVAAISDPTAG